jgi:hypothetical protein
VHRADTGALPRKAAADLHQARPVHGRDNLCTGCDDRPALVCEHRRRGIRVLDRKRPAETTAFFRFREFDELEASHRAQQPQRRGADPHHSQRVARRLIRDAMGEVCADILDAELLDQELRQLEDARRDLRAQLANRADTGRRR